MLTIHLEFFRGRGGGGTLFDNRPNLIWEGGVVGWIWVEHIVTICQSAIWIHPEFCRGGTSPGDDLQNFCSPGIDCISTAIAETAVLKRGKVERKKMTMLSNYFTVHQIRHYNLKLNGLHTKWNRFPLSLVFQPTQRYHLTIILLSGLASVYGCEDGREREMKCLRQYLKKAMNVTTIPQKIQVLLDK